MTAIRCDTLARALATRRAVVAGGVGLAAAGMTGRAAAQDATPTDCPDLSADEMVAQVTALVAAWNSQDLGELEQLFDPGHTHHWGGQAEPLDLDGYLAAMETMYTAFDDLTFTAEDIFAAGDAAALRFTLSGMQVKEFHGFPPGDHPATWSAIAILTFRCGRIVEAWVEADHLGRLQQQGSLPAPEPATPAG